MITKPIKMAYMATSDHTCQPNVGIDIEFEKPKDLYRILRAKRAKQQNIGKLWGK